MSDTPQTPPTARFEVQVPDELRVGNYANFLSVWHSEHDFTLDFAVADQPMLEASDSSPSGQSVVVPCRVVARIRIPSTVAEDVLRAMASNITEFENKVGRISSPGEMDS